MANVTPITNDLIPVASETFQGNLTATITAGAVTVPVDGASEYTDGDSVVITIEPGTANEATFWGIKNGNQFDNCKWTEGNVGVGHTAGATMIDYASATHHNLVRKAFLKDHNPDGSHKSIAVPDPTPVGAVMAFAGAVAPTGWLLCDGAAISRAGYADLYIAIGAAYGAGNGSTTFNLPDLRGRVIAGVDGAANRLTGLAGGINGDTLGTAGGSQSHTLTTAQLAAHAHGVNDPAHSHHINDPGHAHIINDNVFGAGSTNTTAANAGYKQITWGNQATNAAATGIWNSASGTGISIQNAGGGEAHNIVQPTLIMNYIIKT